MRAVRLLRIGLTQHPRPPGALVDAGREAPLLHFIRDPDLKRMHPDVIACVGLLATVDEYAANLVEQGALETLVNPESLARRESHPG